MLRCRVLAVVPTIVLTATSLTSGAATLNEITSGNVFSGNAYVGVKVTTPSGGPFDHITFSFLSPSPDLTPIANGTLFLLSKPYDALQSTFDTPDHLSTSSDGYIAQATAGAGTYRFNTTLTLQGNTPYYFYSNGSANVGLALTGNFELATTSNNPYTSLVNVSPNFRLSGVATPGVAAPAAVPLPSALSLGITSLPILLLSLSLHRHKMRA